MKNIIISIIILTSIQLTEAQTTIKPTGGFGSPIFTITQVGDQTGLTIGGGGGIYINNRFFFGGYGEGTIIEHNPKETPYEKHYFEMGSGGFWLGYSQKIKNRHYVNLAAQMGFGRAYLLRNEDVSFYDDVSYIKPIIEYEFRFNKNVGIAAGIAWPFFNDFEIPAYEAKDLSKPAANNTLKIGWLQ
jgi:hypothetical protein